MFLHDWLTAPSATDSFVSALIQQAFWPAIVKTQVLLITLTTAPSILIHYSVTASRRTQYQETFILLFTPVLFLL